MNLLRNLSEFIEKSEGIYWGIEVISLRNLSELFISIEFVKFIWICWIKKKSLKWFKNSVLARRPFTLSACLKIFYQLLTLWQGFFYVTSTKIKKLNDNNIKHVSLLISDGIPMSCKNIDMVKHCLVFQFSLHLCKH